MKNTFRIIASLSVLLGLAACQQYKIDTQMTPEKAAANIRLVCDALPAYSVPALNPGDVTFSITANTPWTITRSSGADWCTVTPASSAASSLISDITVKLESNPGFEERSATLTIKGDNVPVAKTITITQAKNGQLFVTPVAQDYAAVGGPLNFTLNTNKAWEVRSSASWLSFNRESGNPDPEGRTITIVATAEPSDVMERTATVTVSTEDDEESFEVTQRGIFDLAEISDSFTSEGGTQYFTLRTDLPWRVSSDKTWVSFDQEEGVGNGKNLKVYVTAEANVGSNRKAGVTVWAGGSSKTFEVAQRGFSFEIVRPESTEIPRQGTELLLTVNSDMDWEPASSVPEWAVEKADASHIKLTIPANQRFAALEGVVSIQGAGGAYDGITLTQPCNFTLEGHYELLPDGAVKIYNDVATKVTPIDQYRFLKMTLKLGDVSFENNGRLWVVTKAGSGNIYNQLTVGGTMRLRNDGYLSDGATSTYANAKYSLSLDEMNQLKTYRFNIVPDPENAKNHIMEFYYNEEETPRGVLTNVSAIADLPGETFAYWFGVASEDLVANGSWYVVETCEIIPVEG